MSAIIHKKILIISILWLSLLISCFRQSNIRYPAELKKNIDLFFIENQNDSLLRTGNSTHLPENLRHVNNIFKAAALSESGRADSAETILQGIHPKALQEVDLYYYHTILALTQFRLNYLEEAFHTATLVMKSKIYDIRCLALTERIMARIMTYYENYEHAVNLFHLSSEHYREAGLDKSVAVNQKFQASLYAELGLTHEAIEKIKEAESTLQLYDDKEELYYLYIVAIKTHLNQQQEDSAQYYAKLAMETADFTCDKQKQTSIYNYIGMIESSRENWPAAIASFEKVIAIEEHFFGSQRLKSAALIGLASIYNELDEPEEAKKYAIQAIDFTKNRKWTNLQHDAYKELAITFQKTDPEKAKIFLDSAESNKNKYHHLSAKSVVNFTKMQIELNKAGDKIGQLQKKQNKNRIIFHLLLFLLVAANITLILIYIRSKKTEKSKPHIPIDLKEDSLFNQFKAWLEDNKRYLQPDCKLSSIAAEMNTNRSYLSKAVNSQGVGFTEIINRYRILEAIAIFENKNDPRHHLNIEELSVKVGFHTRSAFFDSFRKETGMTPRQYREKARYEKVPNNANGHTAILPSNETNL